MAGRKNDIQKTNIIIIARKLFYDQGYKNTYLDEIADCCGITKALITYYFDSKANLAELVHESYSTELKNKVSYALFKGYYETNDKAFNFQISTVTEIKLGYKIYFDDPKVARFFDERADDKYLSFIKGDVNKLQALERQNFFSKHSLDENIMIARGGTAAAYAIARSFHEGELSCSEEECLNYITSIPFRFMGMDLENFKTLIDESDNLLNNFDLSIQPYFCIKLNPKTETKKEQSKQDGGWLFP